MHYVVVVAPPSKQTFAFMCSASKGGLLPPTTVFIFVMSNEFSKDLVVQVGNALCTSDAMRAAYAFSIVVRHTFPGVQDVTPSGLNVSDDLAAASMGSMSTLSILRKRVDALWVGEALQVYQWQLNPS